MFLIPYMWINIERNKVNNMTEEEYREEEYTDFMIKLYRGAIVPPSNPNYNNYRGCKDHQA